MRAIAGISAISVLRITMAIPTAFIAFGLIAVVIMAHVRKGVFVTAPQLIRVPTAMSVVPITMAILFAHIVRRM